MAIRKNKCINTDEEVHTQEIFFDNNTVRCIEDITSIERGQWFHLKTKNGTDFITNPDRILFIRIKNK